MERHNSMQATAESVYTYGMLQLSNYFLNRSVLSLRTGGAIAVATQPVINPNNLKIEGFYCNTAQKGSLILLCQDIRETLPDGFVIDDLERLADPEDLVRLKDVLELNFDLIGKQVVTIDKHKIGKVSDYAVDTSSMYVQKIYSTQSIFKSLTGGSLSIDRTQVQEVTPRKIIITELQPKNPLPVTAPVA
jgi:sporulation protein YlmC with PRC-barrel domain